MVTQFAQTQQNKTRPTYQSKRQLDNSIQPFLSVVLKIAYAHSYWVSIRTTPCV